MSFILSIVLPWAVLVDTLAPVLRELCALVQIRL